MRFQRLQQTVDNFVSRPPGNVPSRNGIAGTINAAFRPVHQRKEFDALAVQEFKNIFARVLAIKLSPATRPIVSRFVSGYALPIAPRQLGRVLDAEPALVGRADHVDTAKGLPGQAAEVFALVFVDQQNAPPRPEQFMGGDDSGQPAAGDHDLGLEFPQLGHAETLQWNVRCRSGVSSAWRSPGFTRS